MPVTGPIPERGKLVMAPGHPRVEVVPYLKARQLTSFEFLFCLSHFVSGPPCFKHRWKVPSSSEGEGPQFVIGITCSVGLVFACPLYKRTVIFPGKCPFSANPTADRAGGMLHQLVLEGELPLVIVVRLEKAQMSVHRAVFDPGRDRSRCRIGFCISLRFVLNRELWWSVWLASSLNRW